MGGLLAEAGRLLAVLSLTHQPTLRSHHSTTEELVYEAMVKPTSHSQQLGLCSGGNPSTPLLLC